MKDPIDLGLTAYQSGRLRAAERHFSAALSSGTLGSGDAQMARLFPARCLGDRGRVQEALEYYEAALPLPAAFDDLWNHFNSEAREAFRVGERALARSSYDRSVSLAQLWLRLYGTNRSVNGGQADEATSKLKAMLDGDYHLYSEHLGVELPPVERLFSKTDLKFISKLLATSGGEPSEKDRGV